jgi:hypothetical protein
MTGSPITATERRGQFHIQGKYRVLYLAVAAVPYPLTHTLTTVLALIGG